MLQRCLQPLRMGLSQWLQRGSMQDAHSELPQLAGALRLEAACCGGSCCSEMGCVRLAQRCSTGRSGQVGRRAEAGTSLRACRAPSGSTVGVASHQAAGLIAERACGPAAYAAARMLGRSERRPVVAGPGDSRDSMPTFLQPLAERLAAAGSHQAELLARLPLDACTIQEPALPAALCMPPPGAAVQQVCKAAVQPLPAALLCLTLAATAVCQV